MLDVEILILVFCDESLQRAVVCGVDKGISVGQSMQLDGGKSICYVFYDFVRLLSVVL